MKITEHNCEEYFLLYIDNELTKDERSAVENFIRQNPRYQSSFDALQQAKLLLDEKIVFAGKKDLHKQNENEIGIGNYETYFLLYTDNELSDENKAATERFVLQHPHLQQNFMLLQETRLPLENIECKNKEKLFKKERERRILPLYTGRWVAAASVVTLIAAAWLLMNHKGERSELTASNTQPKSSVVIPLNKPIIKSDNRNIQQFKSDDTLQVVITQQKEATPLTVKENKSLAGNAIDNQKTNDSRLVAEQPQQIKIAPQQQTDKIVFQQQAQTVNSAETLKPLDDAATEESVTQTASFLASDNSVNSQPAVYKELDTDEDNHTLYVGSFQLNRAKVNGLLKGASRLLGSKARGATAE